MAPIRIWAFFYGSNINLDILKRVGYIPQQVEVATLDGYDIRIDPLANLVRSEAQCVYGILADATHGDLARLYGDYVQGELGVTYLPEAVNCRRMDGSIRPALCYIATPTKTASATNAYLDSIIVPAREFAFPDWYIQRLEQYRVPE
jgi:hypothetical protein